MTTGNTTRARDRQSECSILGAPRFRPALVARRIVSRPHCGGSVVLHAGGAGAPTLWSSQNSIRWADGQQQVQQDQSYQRLTGIQPSSADLKLRAFSPINRATG